MAKPTLKETHIQGHISIENLPEELAEVILATDERLMRTGGFHGDFGMQIAEDGRVWICLNGIAFLRFSPHKDGKMSRS